MEHIAPKKSLGQNFLVDRNIAAKIVREFGPIPDEPIIEIGPGEGALTGLLVDAGMKVVAVELDREAAAAIKKRFEGRVEVIQQDFLTVNLRDIANSHGVEKIRVIGNIPYYITSPILFRLIEFRDVVSEALLMMQREVAERLTAQPRTKEYGILSVAAQTYGVPERLFNVPPGCFYPRPKVTSTVLRLKLIGGKGIEGIEGDHRRIVRGAFSKRRKTLNNALSELIPDAEERERLFRRAEIDPRRRAEELTPQDFTHLARIFADARASDHGGQAF